MSRAVHAVSRALPLLWSMVAAAALGVGCGRDTSSAPAPKGPKVTASASASGQGGGGSGAGATAREDASARAADIEDLWARAKEGEVDDLARLANREGASGLIEEGTRDPGKRRVALAALAYADGLSALPWLAEAADSADEAEARTALESVSEMASRPRRAVDPEDGAEMHVGCDRLLVIARNTKKPKPVRVGALRALRMWSDRGCAKAGDLPTDLDAR